MNYIFFTFNGIGLSIAYKLQQEGHKVIVGMVDDDKMIYASIENYEKEDDETKRIRFRQYNGLLDVKSADKVVEEMIEIEDRQNWFVFFDMNYLFRYADKVRNLGFHGTFPTEEDYLYEIDRKKAKEFVKQYYTDLKILETHVFYSINEAKDFLNKNTDLWVLKPFNTAVETCIADSSNFILARKQLTFALELHKDEYEASGFLLEKFIPNLVEVTPGRIYYDGTLLGVTINFENKTFGSGGVAHQTGCAADLVLPVSLESKINQIAFPPIVDQRAKEHKGLFFWDASLLIDAETDEIYFGEFCANRPGYNVFYSQVAPLPSIDHYFTSVVNKRNPFIIGTVTASTRIFNINRLPDDSDVLSDAPIDILPEVEKDVWLIDVYKKDGHLYTNGWNTDLAAVTGSADNMSDAINNQFENLKGFSYFGKYYRPKSDYLSRMYSTAILNRVEYILHSDLVDISEKMIGDLLK